MSKKHHSPHGKKHTVPPVPKESEHSHGSKPSVTTEAALPLTLTEQLGKKDTLDQVLEHYRAWLPRYQEFAQGRSNFQIEKMIATEHVTPVASYQHTLYQLRVLHQSLINDFVRGIELQRTFDYKWGEADKTKPQWWDEGKEKKLCWYDTDLLRYQHEIDELKMSVKDKLIQLQTFTKVLTAMEEKHGGIFTQEELDAEEPEYWKMRFARQMADEYLDKQTGLGTGNLKSLRMAMAESPVPGSHNKVENFPDLLNAVLSGRETGLEALNAVNESLFGYMNSLGATPPAVPPASKEAVHDTLQSPQKNEAPAPSANSRAQLERLQQAGLGISELAD
jgi:hypothetical protein